MRILAETSPGEVRIAVVDGTGMLVDFAIWRPGRPDGVGDLHRGRVIARVPALGGAFVALADAEGFLPDREGGSGLPAGTMVAVRITRAAQGGKGPRLSAKLTENEKTLAAAASGPPALLARGPNPLERLAARYPEAEVWVDSAGLLAALRPLLGPRLGLRAPVFDDALASEIEALGSPSLALPGGMRAHIYPTPALTAIDVDTASASDARGEKGFAQEMLNAQAIPELARQIRLRNLGGPIVIDFAGMATKRRMRLGPALAAALASDPMRPRFLGFSALGLAEIVRPRTHPPLHELLAGPHATGLAALREAIAGSRGAGYGAMTLYAAPAVVSALESDPVALTEFVTRGGGRLVLVSDPSLAPEGWRLQENA